MTYDKNSFLSGVAVGRQLKGWSIVPKERIAVNYFSDPLLTGPGKYPSNILTRWNNTSYSNLTWTTQGLFLECTHIESYNYGSGARGCFISSTEDHVYYASALFFASENSPLTRQIGIDELYADQPLTYGQRYGAAYVSSITTGSWELVNVKYRAAGDGHSIGIGFWVSLSALGGFYIKNILLTDLTETFGAGNEPTKEEAANAFATWDLSNRFYCLS